MNDSGDLPRCFVDPARWTDDGAMLSPEESHYLLNVLRVTVGQTVTVFDGRGRTGRGRLRLAPFPSGTAPQKKSRVRGQGVSAIAALVLVDDTVMAPVPRWRITVLQAIVRANRMDWAVEKLTELGVTRVAPVQTQRCVVRLSAQQAEERCDRWRRLAVGAARQCGSPWVPAIAPVADLADAVGMAVSSCRRLLVASLGAGAVPLREAVSPLRGESAIEIGMLVGPEGDFTPEELDQVIAAGAVPVSLGPLVFRAETAGLFAAAALRYEAVSPVP